MIIETSSEPAPEPVAVSIASEAGSDLILPAVPRPASQNPYHVYLASLASAESKRAMATHLDQIACVMQGLEYETNKSGIGALFPWECLRYYHTAAIRATLVATDLSPSTVNCRLSALRQVLQTAWSLGLIGTEDRERAQDIKSVKGHRVPAGRSVGRDEVIRMRDACIQDVALGAKDRQGMRDMALILLLWSTGLREAEAASALAEDYDAAERSLKVVGKGNKQRIIFVHANAAEVLERWLEVTGATSGPIFRRIDKHGNILEDPLSPDGVRYIVKVRHAQAGLRPLTPHDFRRTFIGDILDAGAHLPQAQALAGHAFADTTAKYVRHELRALREAVDRLSVPPMPEGL
jgi:site-specific recombinase XerD